MICVVLRQNVYLAPSRFSLQSISRSTAGVFSAHLASVWLLHSKHRIVFAKGMKKCQLVQAAFDQKQLKNLCKAISKPVRADYPDQNGFRFFIRYAIFNRRTDYREIFRERSEPSCTAIRTTAQAIRMYLSKAMSPV